MNGRTVGWAVSLGVFAAGAAFAAVVSVASDETKRRIGDSGRLLRERTAATAGHLWEQTAETANELRDQWTETALEVRDRWTTTAEDVRARAIDTAEDWREKSTEGIERALRQAAEARDDALEALPDDDEAAPVEGVPDERDEDREPALEEDDPFRRGGTPA